MKLDLRYKLHQAVNIGTIGLFGPVMVLFCLHKGMNLYQVGLFFGVYFLAITCFELPSGAWADKFGRLKVFYWAKLLDCLNFALLIWFDAIVAIILASFIGGIGRALGSGVLEAWYVESLKRQQRQSEIGHQLSSTHAWSLVGMAIGALTGAGLVQFFGNSLNVDNPYLPTLIMALTLHAFILLSTPYFYHEGESETPPVEAVNSDTGRIRETLVTCWSHPILKIVLLLQLVFGILLTSTQTYWQPVLKTMLKVDTNILIFGLVSALFFIFAAVAANIVKKKLNKSENKLDSILFLLFSVSSSLLILMALSHSVVGYITLYVSFGFFIFTIKPLLAIIMHQHICDRFRATSLSLLSLMFNLGGLLVGLLFSLIADKLGIDVLWWLMGMLGLLTSFLFKSRQTVVHPA